MLDFMSLEKARRSQTSVAHFGIDAAEPALVAALAAFTNGRCAFCESMGNLSAHRFRPAGNALPAASRKDAHLFYVWLADAWQNLLPICHECRPGEPLFPVEGSRCSLPSPQQVRSYVERGSGLWPSYPPNERNLLIDPSRETGYDRHLTPKLDGTLVPLSPRAAITVETYRLNRDVLARRRSTVFEERLRDLGRLLSRGAGAKSTVDDAAWSTLFEFRKLEFGGTWLLLLKRVAARIRLADGSPADHSIRQLRQAFRSYSKLPDAPERLASAIRDIMKEDPSLVPVDPTQRRTARARSRLGRVLVEGFKGVERMDLQIPPPRSDADGRPVASALVILGENATGKSSVLEAIALTLASETARRILDLDWRTIPLDPGQMGGEESKRRSPARVRLEFDSGQTATLSIGDDGTYPGGELGTERVSVFAYGAFRRFSDDAPSPNTSQHIRNLFDASPLPNPEGWLRSLSPQTFETVIRALRDLLSIEGDFEVIQRAGRSRRLKMVTALARPDGTQTLSQTPLHAVSSGYRSMLGMLCGILRGLVEENGTEELTTFAAARGVVLIDEIEAHLHPRWKVQVMTSLRRTLPGMTFIVTTHDPLCLRGMAEGEVVVLQRVSSADAGVQSALPMTIERMTGLPDASDLRIEQLLTSDFFQLFSTTDAATDRNMARVGDLIKKRKDGDVLTLEEARTLNEFERDIATALPVGSSEVHRLVQEAVAEYLEKRREASSATLARLTAEAKAGILAALETL